MKKETKEKWLVILKLVAKIMPALVIALETWPIEEQKPATQPVAA